MFGSEIFKDELALINDGVLRDFTEFYLDENYVPDYFWHIGASSTGKFHPAFAQGEGGLVRHTKAVVMIEQELLRMSSYAYMKEDYKDYATIACILHDTAKYGLDEFDKSEYEYHGENASKNIDTAWVNFFGEHAPYLLTHAVHSHMGQWTTDERPFTTIDRLVHLSDYIASRNFIDIPVLHGEE